MHSLNPGAQDSDDEVEMIKISGLAGTNTTEDSKLIRNPETAPETET